jgi:CubicO group peptidase (beta-lactamase class C family)
MALLGDVVAVRSGMPYEAYVIEHILEPLGLADTRPELPASLRRDRLATGYGMAAPDGSREALACFRAKALASAVGFSSTVRDLARFAVWQLRALEEIEDPVLNGNTLREMQRTHWEDPDGTNRRGLGFEIYDLDGEKVMGHGGGCPGYLSRFRVMPKRRWAVIVIANGLGVNVDQYADGMFRILRAYDDEQAVEIAPEVELEDYTGNYRSLWEREIIIVPWKGKLALFNLGYPDQKKPELVLRHIEGDLFRRVRDDEVLGEEVRFERDQANRVVRYWQTGQFIDKLDL